MASVTKYPQLCGVYFVHNSPPVGLLQVLNGCHSTTKAGATAAERLNINLINYDVVHYVLRV